MKTLRKKFLMLGMIGLTVNNAEAALARDALCNLYKDINGEFEFLSSKELTRGDGYHNFITFADRGTISCGAVTLRSNSTTTYPALRCSLHWPEHEHETESFTISLVRLGKYASRDFADRTTGDIYRMICSR
jgi:hypothetical protein